MTFARVVAAEGTRLASVRSTVWTALATVVAAASVALGLGLFVRTGDGTSGTALVVSGAVVAQLGALVLGVLAGTADYTWGTATTTYTAVPRRLPALAAQALVVVAAALVVAALALTASILVTAAQRDTAGLPLDLAEAGSWRPLAGFTVYIVCVALLGLGAGSLLRHPAAALVSGIGLLLVLDSVLAANPGRICDTVRSLLPGVGTRLLQDDAQVAATEAASLGPNLGVGGATLVLLGWVLVVLLAAAVRLQRSDVTMAARQ